MNRNVGRTVSHLPTRIAKEPCGRTDQRVSRGAYQGEPRSEWRIEARVAAGFTACIAAVALGGGTPAHAQYAQAAAAAAAADYPNRPFRLVVPFAPGGSVDVFARLVGTRLSEAMGQPVVIDNRGGGGGVLGMEIVARAPSDGYNLLVHSAAFTTAAALHTKLPFDPIKDLLPLAQLGAGANILTVRIDSPATTLQELIALARNQPGKLNYGSGGPGSSSHLTTEVLLRMAKLDIVHIPYKGLGPAVTALLGGQVQMLLVGMPNVMPHIRSGRLRAIAVSTPKRSPFVPDVPTLDEAGVTGYSVANWWGMWGPGGTSPAVVKRINAEVGKILQTTALRERLAAEGAEPVAASPEEFARMVRVDIAFWRKVALESGIRID